METRNQFQGLVALVALSLVGLAGCGHDETAVAREGLKVVKARVLVVREVATPGSYTVTGTVKALLNATLASKVSGRVISVAVREGDHIKKNQPLVSIDSRELQAGVDVATANYRSSVAEASKAKTAAEMAQRSNEARISQAKSQVQESNASLASAEARRDQALAGPRRQELAQSHIAVEEAQSDCTLAKHDLDRTTILEKEGALSREQLDVAQNRYDLAKGHLDDAMQAENMAREGSRSEEVRAAEEGVEQAKAALQQANSAYVQARADAMQVQMRRKDVEVANAEGRQASAEVQSARVSLSYGKVLAPFDGLVVQRMVDPGSMASSGVPLLAVIGGGFRLEVVVPEEMLRYVAVGDSEPVTIDALNQAQTYGRVAEIVPQGDPTAHSYIAKLALGSLPGLKSGMFGKCNLVTATVNRILVPASAVWEREGLHYVFALDKSGIARLRIVTLGDPHADKIEILSGLTPGDQVVVGDREDVSEGVKVEAQ